MLKLDNLLVPSVDQSIGFRFVATDLHEQRILACVLLVFSIIIFIRKFCLFRNRQKEISRRVVLEAFNLNFGKGETMFFTAILTLTAGLILFGMIRLTESLLDIRHKRREQGDDSKAYL